jgi:mannose-1-phosphate guanylyltransferase
VWVIVSGKGILTIDGVDSVVCPGCVVEIPLKAKHTILAATELEFIEVQLGTGDLAEEDIVKISG